VTELHPVELNAFARLVFMEAFIGGGDASSST
jgi:hypothetical protein